MRHMMILLSILCIATLSVIKVKIFDFKHCHRILYKYSLEFDFHATCELDKEQKN